MSETTEVDGCYGVTSSKTMATYVLSLLATVIITVAGPLTGDAGILVITVPMALVLVFTIFSDKEFIHIPPAMVLIMVATFLLATVGRLMDGEVIRMVSVVLWGVNLGMIGIVCVFMLRGTVTGVSVPESKLVLPVSLSVAMAIYALTAMFQHYMSMVWDGMIPVDVDLLMNNLVLVLLGALIVGLLYMSRYTQSLFERTVDSFLSSNSDKCEVEEKRRNMILEIIKGGESDSLEFKSTLKTNINTDKGDKRMEKAVLKSIVAFMNTDGGTLLVGVDDYGGILGADVHKFESPDKFILHFSHLIKDSIGNEYLPYIKYSLVRFPSEEGTPAPEKTVINGKEVPYSLPEEKYVLRVTCYRYGKPVFLNFDNKETFYVRAGASSVVLEGSDLLKYIANRSRKGRNLIANRGTRDEEDVE